MTDIVVDYDPELWLHILPAAEEDGEAWAMRAARTAFAQTSVTPSAEVLTELATNLLSLYDTYAADPGFAFIWLPDLFRVPGPVAQVQSGPLALDEAEIEVAVGVGNPDLLEPVALSRLQTPLGTALRGRQLIRIETTALLGYTYVWQVHAVEEFSIELTCWSRSIDMLRGLEGALDDLARTVSVREPA